jgi:hypothetical protein
MNLLSLVHDWTKLSNTNENATVLFQKKFRAKHDPIPLSHNTALATVSIL